MKQTAVDYYSKEIGRLTSDLITGKIIGKQFVILEIKLLEQAKEIEKEQHGKTWDCSIDNLDARSGNVVRAWADFDDFYNETYRGDK
jgi:hypothetical protein